jgi:putative hydrolase of the HAD superfamily
MIPRPLAVVFDMDDTLYLERDYVRSGFDAVGRWLRQSLAIDGFADLAWKLFQDGRRGDIFDRALEQLPVTKVTAAEVTVADLVARYRRHRPRIAMAPDAQRWIARKGSQCPLALITDGPPASQSRKVTALGLRRIGFAPIILTGRWGDAFRKPDHRGFRAVERHLGLAGQQLVYVADNPAKDFIAPRQLGWSTVQIVREGAIHAAAPAHPQAAADRVITTLDELDWI